MPKVYAKSCSQWNPPHTWTLWKKYRRMLAHWNWAGNPSRRRKKKQTSQRGKGYFNLRQAIGSSQFKNNPSPGAPVYYRKVTLRGVIITHDFDTIRKYQIL